MASNTNTYYCIVCIGELKNVYMTWLYNFKKQHSFSLSLTSTSLLFLLLAHSNILHPFSPIFTHNTMIWWNSNRYVCTSRRIVNRHLISREYLYAFKTHLKTETHVDNVCYA